MLSDGPGWLVIHADADGAPGPVLGQTPLVAGVNEDIVVTLEGEITETLFPMLPFDTGEMGVYEFGTVDGADGPVTVNDAVVTGPMTPEAGMESRFPPRGEPSPLLSARVAGVFCLWLLAVNLAEGILQRVPGQRRASNAVRKLAHAP
jgi:hypothetical protein